MSSLNMIHISVTNLVEIVLRRGSIDSRYISSSRISDGTKFHQKIQSFRKKTAKLNNSQYISEFKLICRLEYGNFEFEIEGRADGIIISNNYIAIEEIKTTIKDLDFIDDNYNILHWAQAKCYAYIYALQNYLDSISVELTYCQTDTEELKTFKKVFSLDELKDFFYKLIENYMVWAKMSTDWIVTRNKTIKSLKFPYIDYRKNQREFSIAIYKTILNNKKIFAQAPTGTGKTISTIFPSIKAIGEGYCSKIFYTTAKTITRKTAEEAFFLMQKQGLKFKSITLTAKEKICFCKDKSCNPEQCTYANGHFDRVNNAIINILKNENQISRIVIENYSQKYVVCPFEFSLDIALWCDCIICDYNYIFNPKVYLRRFFQDNDNCNYTLLIDEAHNLVDRAREMFSASINKKIFLKIKKLVKDKNINKVLNKINNYMLDITKNLNYDEKGIIQNEEPVELYTYIIKFIKIADKWLIKNESSPYYQEFLECYFNCVDFIKTSENYDDKYITYIELDNHDVIIKLFCLDPSYLLKQAQKRVKATIFFSATLTPIDYFKNILGGEKDDFFIRLPSPFKCQNLNILIACNISTSWKNRENSYNKIADYLYFFSMQKSGNYMAFFPSYQYMNIVHDIFTQKYTNINTIIQNNNMNEEDKENYLKHFENNYKCSLLSFAVMGGIFSEGIDLTGDKLIGAAIIGVGLPQLSMERNIISDYYKNLLNKGYEYSYMYPGMNKVMQAGGRVIRTEEDRGIILLIDERFLYNDYKQLLPYEWQHYKKIYDITQLKRCLSEFWNTKENF